MLPGQAVLLCSPDVLVCTLDFFIHSFSLNAEHPKKIFLHHSLVGSLPRGATPADGQPVPQLAGGDDVTLPVSHRAAGRGDGEAALRARIDTVCVSHVAHHAVTCVRVCVCALSWK